MFIHSIGVCALTCIQMCIFIRTIYLQLEELEKFSNLSVFAANLRFLNQQCLSSHRCKVPSKQVITLCDAETMLYNVVTI